MKNEYPVQVHWGDCDPADIVYYPNYFVWIDKATHALMAAHGLSQALIEQRFGIRWFPIAEASSRFLRPSSHGDEFTIVSRVESWTDKRFTIVHRGLKHGTLLFEGREARFFGGPHADDPARLRVVPVPAEILAIFGKPD
jgi:4-hydroxybenzoyl-CoA thioesterase